MAEASSSPERIAAAYKRLAASAESLSSKSDEFSKQVAVLDGALKKLNLGIVAWQRIRGGEDRNGNFWSEDVGYAKVNGKWGIAIRERRGNTNADNEENEEWLFNDAPRTLRISAVDQMSSLLDKLVSSAGKTAKRIEEKTAQAKSLATALSRAVSEIEQERKGRKS
jgi:prefoldin subunit 5